MNPLLRDMHLFVEVAKYSSFTLAADALDMYISTLSRRIAQLEKDLGVPLFRRSTRHVELTDSGRALYEKCLFLLSEAENAYDEVVQNMTRPGGPVRLAVPADVYHSYLWGIGGRFAAEYPDINLSIHFTQRWVDLLSEPYDLDIRVGPLPDSELRARKLASIQTALYASPKLLETYPAPRTPADLKNIPCISFTTQGATWAMRNGKKAETVTIKTAHSVNSISLALEFCLAGLGVAWLSPVLRNHPAARHLHDQLVEILPGWTIPGININVVMSKDQMPLRVRLFVDYLTEYFAGLPHRAGGLGNLPAVSMWKPDK